MSQNLVWEQLRPGDHVCAQVNSIAERRSIAATYAAAGLRDGQKIVFAVDDELTLRRFLLARLPEAERALQAGQIEVLSSRELYLPDGGFSAPRLLENLAESIDAAGREGYAGLRVSGDLSWVERGVLDGDALVDYEGRVNELLVDGTTAVCHYDPRTFDLRTWRRLAAVHPTTVRSADRAATQLRCLRTELGVRVVGEADLANGSVLPSLLAAVLPPSGHCLIDAAELRFADARAVAGLLRAVGGRGGETTVICSAQVARLLALFSAATVRNLTVRVVDRT